MTKGTIPPLPIPTETVGICLQVPFSSEWIGLVTGVLLRLTYNYYWDQDVEGWEQAKAAGEAILKSWFDKVPCNDGDCEDSTCKDFPLSSLFIEFYPLSPYSSPDVTPDGWTAPPFTIATELDALAGYQVGDVFVSGFPSPDSGDLTLPAIRLHLTGAGTTEIHFVNALNGGVAIVTVDSDITKTTTVELNADLVEVPPETLGEEIVYEVKIEETGTHTIDIRFAPVLDDALLPIRFGGGVRAIVLCGFDEMMIDVRQNEDDPCILEKTNDGTTWGQFADLSLCTPEISKRTTPKQWRTNDGHTQYSDDGTTWYEFPDGEQPIFGQNDPVFTVGVDKACVAAKNIRATIQAQVQQWHDALVASGTVFAIAALITAAILVFVTAGAAAPLVILLASEIVAIGAVGIEENLDDAFFDGFECDIYQHIGSDGLFTPDGYASFYDTLQARGGDTWTIISAWIIVNGMIGLNNMVNGAGITTCEDFSCNKTATFDFSVSDWGLQEVLLYPESPSYYRGGGVYNSSYWETIDRAGYSSGYTDRMFSLKLEFDSTYIMSAEMIYDYHPGPHSFGAGLYKDETVIFTQGSDTGDDLHRTYTANDSLTQIVMYASVDGQLGSLSGSAHLKKLIVTYTGATPTGWPSS